MRLEDATKEELIWWIREHAFALSLRPSDFEADIMRRRHDVYMERADQCGEQYDQALKSYQRKSVPWRNWKGGSNLMDGITRALRPISREQVEKVWPGCQMCKGWNTIELKPCANGDLGVQADIGSSGQDDPFGLVVYNKLLASGYIDFKFCPFCGSPKTDEAVDMVMERLEALKDGKGD